MTREKVQIVREFAYPVKTVYQAFTDQSILKHWLAPDGFTCPDVVFDLQVGGRTHSRFRDGEGNDSTSEGVFTQVVPNSFVAYDFEVRYLGYHLENLTTEITFEPTEAGTKVTVELYLADPDFAEGSQTGWNQSMDNLERLLGKNNG